jgi:hypothetical protein
MPSKICFLTGIDVSLRIILKLSGLRHPSEGEVTLESAALSYYPLSRRLAQLFYFLYTCPHLEALNISFNMASAVQ